MSATRSPFRFAGVADVGGLTVHPFAGLPEQIVDQVGHDSAPGVLGLQLYFNHFLQWEGAQGTLVDNTVTSGWRAQIVATTGTATITPMTSVDFGAIQISSPTTINDFALLELVGAPFFYQVGKRMWCFARLQVPSPTLTGVFLGFGAAGLNADPTQAANHPADGIFLTKLSSAGTNLDLVARQNTVSTTRANILGTALTTTDVTVGFLVDAAGNIIPFENGTARTASIIAAGDANIPNVAGDRMCPYIAVSTGAAAIRNLNLDWVLFAQER